MKKDLATDIVIARLKERIKELEKELLEQEEKLQELQVELLEKEERIEQLLNELFLYENKEIFD